MTSPLDLDPTLGHASFEALAPLLAALPAKEVESPRVDLRKAAVVVLHAVSVLERDENLSRLRALPADVFDPSSLSELRALALAAWYVRGEANAAKARGDASARLRRLMSQARALKTRMARVVTHHFAADPSILRDVGAIRAPNGYVQMAATLTRLAQLYAEHAAALAVDGAWYRAADGARAAALASEVLQLVRREDPWPNRVARTWTLLKRRYEVVRRLAEVVLPVGSAAGRLPRLHAAVRKPNGP